MFGVYALQYINVKLKNHMTINNNPKLTNFLGLKHIAYFLSFISRPGN